jgi:hypothetical protein
MTKPLFPIKHSLSRRDFLRLASATAAGALLAACRPEIENTQTPAAAPVTAATTPVPTIAAEAEYYMPVDLANSPMGIGRGIHPGRVTWVYDPEVAAWDGVSGFWWEEKNTRFELAQEMLSQALRAQTGESSDAAAWEQLFRFYNNTHGKSGGYQEGEKVAIKINMNVVGESQAQRDNGIVNSPQMLRALLLSLVLEAGVPASAITVYDAVRHVPNHIFRACSGRGLDGVTVVDWAGGNGRQPCTVDPECAIRWSYEMKGSPACLSTCVTEASYLVNAALLKGHNLAGVTLTAKNHFGSFRSSWKGQDTMQAPQGANLHGFVAAHGYDWGPEWNWPGQPMGVYNALVDLVGNPHLGGKTLLYLVEGLYATPDQQAIVGNNCRWSCAPFDDGWTSSLFVSQDPVAIDSVGLDFLRSEPSIQVLPDTLPAGSTPDNYLHEAALADQPPSGTFYDPAGDGKGLASLGVHEHWNNLEDRQYSRNQDKAEGIELITVM